MDHLKLQVQSHLLLAQVNFLHLLHLFPPPPSCHYTGLQCSFMSRHIYCNKVFKTNLKPNCNFCMTCFTQLHNLEACLDLCILYPSVRWSNYLNHCDHIFCCSQLYIYCSMLLALLECYISLKNLLFFYTSILSMLNYFVIHNLKSPPHKYFVIAHLFTILHKRFVGIFITHSHTKFNIFRCNQ